MKTPTGDGTGGDRRRKGDELWGGRDVESRREKRCIFLWLSTLIEYAWRCECACAFHKFQAECMFQLRGVKTENLHWVPLTHTHTHTHTHTRSCPGQCCYLAKKPFGRRGCHGVASLQTHTHTHTHTHLLILSLSFTHPLTHTEAGCDWMSLSEVD